MEKVIGIMGAMQEEIDGIAALLVDREEFHSGMRTYYIGKLNNIRAVLTFSRWGKVAAATTVSHLILKFGITELLFTGVAGAIDPALRIGDIVIGKKLYQHDMDARPLMPRFEIPLLGVQYFESPTSTVNNIYNKVVKVLQPETLGTVIGEKEQRQFNINSPKVVLRDIASGDKFFASNQDKEALSLALPEIACVEMEGGAVAQVCYEYNVPFTIIRTISDTSDENSHIDFPQFIKSVSSKYSVAIIKSLFGVEQ